MRASFIALASSLAVAAFAVPAMAQVTNGGFELPPVAPPAAGDWQYDGGAARDGSSPHTGSFSANLNNTTSGANANVHQQSIAGTILPNTQYILSYWAKGTYGVSGEGQEEIAFLNSSGGFLPTYPVINQIPQSADYVHYTRLFTSPATASELFISFNAVTGAVSGASSHLYVDDVSFSLVPEPTTIAAAAFGGLALRRRR